MAESRGGFLVTESNGTMHLPTEEGGALSRSLCGAAWAALHGGYRGNTYDGPQKDIALAQLTAIYTRQGWELPKTSSEFSDYHSTLLSGIRSRLKVRGMLRADEFHDMVRQARAAAGGRAKATMPVTTVPAPFSTIAPYTVITADGVTYTMGTTVNSFSLPFIDTSSSLGAMGLGMDGEPDDFPCGSCLSGDFADCTCPVCAASAGDGPDPGCWCQAAMGTDASGATVVMREEPSPLRTSAGEPCRLFLEQALDTLPSRIHVLPRPGLYKHPVYGDLQITPERIADMVEKFNAGVYQRDSSGRPAVPIDAEHDTKLSGAMAWLHQLHLNADGSADGEVSWTDRGRTAMAGDRYKYFSPEWFDEWKDSNTGEKIPNVLIGGALTTRPYFKTNAGGDALRPLVASDAGLAFVEESKQEENGMTTPTVQLTEEQKSFAELRQQMSELQASNAALAEQAKVASEEAKVASEQVRQANERAAALEVENRRRSFADRARGWVGAPVDQFVSFMEGLDEEQRQQFGVWQDAHAAQLQQSGLFAEHGAPGTMGRADNPQAQIDALTRKRAEEQHISFRDAAKQVMAEHPDLMLRAKRYTEINANKPESATE